mgnify:CR=1 FL=1
MSDKVLKNVKKELNFKEKVIIRLFPMTFAKVYYTTKINTIKNICKKLWKSVYL